jgi:hypothetical protein
LPMSMFAQPLKLATAKMEIAVTTSLLIKSVLSPEAE